jgi:hypothetical protein
MPTKIQFEWELPDAVVEAIAQEPAKAAEVIKQAAVLEWVRTHKLSLRRAAELLQTTYRDFLALAASMIGCTEIPVFRSACRPGTTSPSIVMPLNGAAMLAWARASCRCRPSGRVNGCFAEVEGRFRGFKVAMADVLLRR